MEDNYYEILEINKNASPEIIEKAYKTLVKKYHPDLQDDNLKSIYEEKIKKINEAYDVLSNEEKRKEYDLNLQNNEISENDFNNLKNENINLRNEINYLKNRTNYNNYSENINNAQNDNYTSNYENTANYIKNVINQKINNAVNQAYHDAYIEDLKNRGYKIKYKKTFKDFLAFILTISFLIILGFILWQIPFIKNYFIELYNDNEMLKNFIDIITKK